MNWRILDIRVGRANRGQFLLISAWLASMNFMIIEATPPILYYSFLIISIYPLSTIIIRRMRDIGIKKSMIKKALIITIAPMSIYLIIILSIEAKLVNGISGYLLLFFISPLAFAPFLIMSFLFLSMLFLYEGEFIENKYGSPPKGLNFNTMILGNRGTIK